MILFNPGLEIQNSDNYVDWASLTVVHLTDVNWSSRSIPVNAEEPIDVATMTFEIPIWISAPVAVKQFGVIKKIIASIYDADGNLSPNVMDNEDQLIARKVFTPLNYQVLYSGSDLILLKPEDVDNRRGGKFGSIDSWPALLDTYGKVTNGVSQVKLAMPTGSEIIGTITLNPTDATKLIYTPFVDTLPANSLNPIDAIIDPLTVEVGNDLLNPANGTRYLILNDIGSWDNNQPPVIWQGSNNQNFVARANDIIEYNNGWSVSFDSASTVSIQYVTNLTTQIQYRWTGVEWVKSVEGVYPEGEWTIML